MLAAKMISQRQPVSKQHACLQAASRQAYFFQQVSRDQFSNCFQARLLGLSSSP